MSGGTPHDGHGILQVRRTWEIRCSHIWTCCGQTNISLLLKYCLLQLVMYLATIIVQVLVYQYAGEALKAADSDRHLKWSQTSGGYRE